MLTPQFLPVTGEKVPLASLAPNKVNAITIQVLNSSGVATEKYQYMDWAGPDYDQTAWADLDGNIASDVSFEPGQGLWVSASGATDTLTSAGEVGSKDIAVALQYGFTPTGNPFPVRVALQDITCSAVNSVTIQLLNESGVAVGKYQYMDWAGPDYDQTAWADLDGNIPSPEVYIEPGQGLWVQGSSSTDVITFPAPEL